MKLLIAKLEKTTAPIQQFCQDVINGKLSAVKEAIDGGFDVNAKRENLTSYYSLKKGEYITGLIPPLFSACLAGNTEMLQLLIDNKIDINQTIRGVVIGSAGTLEDPKSCYDYYDYGDSPTALMFAARNGKTEICQILIENKADLDKQSKCGGYGHSELGYTALTCAVMSNSPDIVQLLIDNKADANISTNTDCWYAIHKMRSRLTPLNFALCLEQESIVKILVSSKNAWWYSKAAFEHYTTAGGQVDADNKLEQMIGNAEFVKLLKLKKNSKYSAV